MCPGGDRPLVPGGPSLCVSRKAQGPGGALAAQGDCVSPTWGHPGEEADSERASAFLEAPPSELQGPPWDSS